MLPTLYCSLFLILFLSSGGDGFSLTSLLNKKEQSYGVKGTFLCDGKGIEDVKVNLYDKDKFSMNDLLNRQNSDYKGRFSLYGSKKIIFDVVALVKIEHRCNTKGKDVKKIELTIPQKLISEGGVPKTFCDIGTVDLAKASSVSCLTNGTIV
uniref:Transthyretin-like family-containing protein n=1 Tax=Rhabditophanes sp. KR3021 TaxID=114890 RepID=A0AC35TZ54_9BILA